MVISEEEIAMMPIKNRKKMNLTMNNMMKKTRISQLSLFFAAGLALVSCAKEITETPASPDDAVPEYTTITLTATHPEMTEAGAAVQENGATAAVSTVSTKTTLDETTGSVSWAVGDKLKLVCEDGSDFTTEALTEADLKDGGKTATFKATVPAGKALKWAVYPSDIEAALTYGAFSVTVPRKQDGKFEHASIEAGEIGEDNNGNEGMTIALKNVCALLKFTVAEANADAATVFIGGNGAPLNGKANISKDILATQYTLATDVPDYQPNVEVSVSGPGSYYAAILPAKTTGLSMQIYSADNTLLAENISSNVLDAPRKTIRDLGELRSTPFANKRFVTLDGAGDGQGLSWENAWSFKTLLSKLQGAALTDHVIFISEGNIKPSAGIITLKDNTKFKIFGGYPTNLTGVVITDRDINRHATAFVGKDRSGETDNARIFVYNTSATGTETLFDGVGFNDTYQWVKDSEFDLYAGTCLLIGASKNVYCVNCRFNSNYKVGNGIIRVGSTSSTAANAAFERCVFSNNTVTGKGLIRVYTKGKVTFTDCDFTGNNIVEGDENAPYRICFATNTADVTDGGGNKLADNQTLK